MYKYELATSIHWKYDKTEASPLTKSIERIIKAGFRNLDFAFCNMTMNQNSNFLKDTYLEWLKECRDFTDSRGVKFVQAHAPCESIYDKNNYELLVELCKKAILGCQTLGIPWMVFHTLRTDYGQSGKIEDINLRFFRTLLPLAEKCNVGIAIENLVPQYFGHPASEITDEQIALIDALDSEMVGACWDVGHANVCYGIKGAEHIAHQSEQIKKLGHRLKCTHIHDNNTKRFATQSFQLSPEQAKSAFSLFDEHIAPFGGNIDWNDVIEGLDAIGYTHYFTYEAHQAVNPLPDNVADTAMKMMYEIGNSLISKSRLV